MKSKIMSYLDFPPGSLGFLVFTLCLLAAILSLPSFALEPGSEQFIFVVGGLALWRYSWGMLHFVRHLIFRKSAFPKMRAAVDSDTDNLMPSKVYLMVTSFRIEAHTSIKVWRAAIEEAITAGVPTTIVASIVEKSDEFLVKDLFRQYDTPADVKLMIVRIPGTGKRDGLAQGFRAISRDMPPADAVVAVIDGDSILQHGLVRKCAPFFKYNDKLGALTTDEDCQVEGTRLMREWHDMRFAQRQILMSSLALSGRVMTLTGRMSMFRADIVTNPDFIAHVESDHLDHWRLGRFRFLTGDDKSSLYWVMQQQYETLYVPDVLINTVEHPPSGNFVGATSKLMFRWFGNMLRTNARILKLGPLHMPFFVWWCFVDQRISMWTALTGPVFAILLSVKYSLTFLFIYLVWIAFTRWIMALMLFAARPVLSWYYPFLIYYNQIWGSLIKTYVFFRLDRQSWTRQKTKLNRGLDESQARWVSFTSNFLHGVALVCFVCIIGVISGLFRLPGSY